jgi:hypothetical protein
MGHALFNGVYDSQGGPRGGDKTFLAGMVMGMAQHSLGDGSVGFKAMLSPDPFMGKSGYPLLLATGETADGEHPLVDRQHPHDLFMELSASYSHPLGGGFDGYVYAGLPGEPAFGPPAFMHRQAAMDSPEAPITHHWFDSTHITFGVVTAGVSRRNWKVEASAFRGREPDQHRYDIETGRLDSVSTRISWNPALNWALQASWTRINSPEALEPDDDEARASLSALYSRRSANDVSRQRHSRLGPQGPHPGQRPAGLAVRGRGPARPALDRLHPRRAGGAGRVGRPPWRRGDGAQAVGGRDLRRAAVGQRSSWASAAWPAPSTLRRRWAMTPRRAAWPSCG